MGRSYKRNYEFAVLDFHHPDTAPPSPRTYAFVESLKMGFVAARQPGAERRAVRPPKVLWLSPHRPAMDMLPADMYCLHIINEEASDDRVLLEEEEMESAEELRGAGGVAGVAGGEGVNGGEVEMEESME